MSAVTQPWWAEGARVLEPIRSEARPPLHVAADGLRLECNPAVTTVRTIPGALSLAECTQALSLAAAQPRVRGRDLDGYGRRECICAWIPAGGVSRWLYQRVAELFEEANATFQFRLSGIVEPLLAVAYDEGGHFDWHLDTGPEVAATRKLSLSIVLSQRGEYEGGQLEFAGQAEPVTELDMGHACIFPSFLAHRVAPVTRGRRISLVAFAHGPTFS